MSSDRKRTTVAPGIYRDKFGYSVVVWPKDSEGKQQQLEERFPLTSEVSELTSKRNRWIKALKLEAGAAGPAAESTLKTDLARFIEQLPPDVSHGINKRRTREYFRLSVKPFIGEFGQRPTHLITADDVRRVMAKIVGSGKAAATANKARGALCRMCNVLYPEGPNPTKGVSNYSTVYDDPRGFDMTMLREIIEGMPDIGAARKESERADVNLAKLRLRVMLETGMPPSTLMRIEPQDAFIKELRKLRSVKTKPRRKGKGAKGVNIPLTTEGVEAMCALVEHAAFGGFDQRAVNRCFKRAVARYKTAWMDDNAGERWPLPADIHAYDLRHAFLSELYRRSGNLHAVARVAGHSPKSVHTVTARYTAASVDEVTRTAVDAMNAV